MIERSLHACGSGSTRLHVRVVTAWPGGQHTANTEADLSAARCEHLSHRVFRRRGRARAGEHQNLERLPAMHRDSIMI